MDGKDWALNLQIGQVMIGYNQQALSHCKYVKVHMPSNGKLGPCCDPEGHECRLVGKTTECIDLRIHLA